MEHATTAASTSTICDQPTSVIATSSKSEFFGTDQGVEEIEAEQHGHDQSDDGLAHEWRSLKLTQGESVETHQPNDRKAKRHEREIQHDRLLADLIPPCGIRFRFRIGRFEVRIS